MTALRLWWRILRGGNLVMMVITLFIIWWVTDYALSSRLWMSIALGTATIGGAGNLLNDLCDCEMDALNKPHRVWLGTAVQAATVWRVYWALQGLVLGIALLVGVWQVAVLFALESAALYAYSKHWKCQPVVGNVVVAALCAVLVLQYWGLAYEALTPHWRGWLLSYAGFAFGSNWVREWVKDLEDRMGDAAVGCQTLAVRWSWRANRRGLLILWSAWLVGLCWAGYAGDFFGINQIRHIYGGIMISSTSYLSVQLWQLQTREDAARISQYLKGYMLLGMIGVLWG